MKNLKFINLAYIIVFALIMASCSKNEVEDLNVSDETNTIDEVDTTEISEIDILYFGADEELGNFIDDVANQLREYKKSNPEASDEQLNEFVEKIMNQSNLRSAKYDLDGYVTGKLNSKEKALYKSNKAKALLCMANGKFAIKYSEKYYKASVLHNGNGDAFRHCIWNYGMTIDVGSSFAKKWSDAHEYGTSNQPALERKMDLYNNSVGIQLGKDNPYTIWHSTFISKTRSKVRNGKLRIIKNNKLAWSNKSGEK